MDGEARKTKRKKNKKKEKKGNKILKNSQTNIFTIIMRTAIRCI